MGDSIAARAEQGEHETDDAQLFPMGSMEGDKVTLSKIVKPGEKVSVEVSLRAASVPVAGGGLIDPRRDRKLLVTVEPGGPIMVPQRDEGKIASWTARQILRPIYVEAVQGGTAGDLEGLFAELLDADPTAASKALDSMQAKAVAVLGT